MNLTDIANIISSIGFPIVMCLYLIHHNEKKLEEVDKTIEQNSQAILRLLAFLKLDEGANKNE